ncbi:MAG TPA: hypothetical protein VMH36_10075 [Alphaproteobacteria bacterium]|nr:hypothetical protein [Alphaproteobacteria bacterium]
MAAKLDRVRLVKVLGMLGSRHDGEVLAAARLAQYMLGQAKMNWADLLNVKPGEEPEPLPQEEDVQAAAAEAAAKSRKYTDPDYPQMLKVVLRSRALNATSRKRLEAIEEQLRRGFELTLDDKLLVRWLYNSAGFKAR